MDSAVYVLALVLAITMVISALSNQIRQNKVTQERYRNFNSRRFNKRERKAPTQTGFARKFSKPRPEVTRPSSGSGSGSGGFFSGIFNNTTPPTDPPRGSDDMYTPKDDRYDTRSNGPTQHDLDRIRALKSQSDTDRERERSRETEMENHKLRVRECQTKSDMVKDKVELLHFNLDTLKSERPVFNQDGRVRVEGKLHDAQRTMNELRDILNDSGQCASIEAPITTQPVFGGGYK